MTDSTPQPDADEGSRTHGPASPEPAPADQLASAPTAPAEAVQPSPSDAAAEGPDEAVVGDDEVEPGDADGSAGAPGDDAAPVVDEIGADTAAAQPGPGSAADPEPEPGPPDPEPEPEPVILPADDPASIDAARQAVRAGECIVLPTDTVYGIAADAFAPVAVQRLLDAKRRGRDMPPPVLIADGIFLDTLAAEVPQAARDLAARHWPGPLTLILTAQPSLRVDLGDTGGTIAVRVPDHDVARAILRRTGPLAVSSANVSGQAAATTAAEAAAQLRSTVAVYVDAGTSPGSVPSTIIDFAAAAEGRIVRAGVLTHAELVELAPDLVDGTAVPEPADGVGDAGDHDPSGTPDADDAAPPDPDPTDPAAVAADAEGEVVGDEAGTEPADEAAATGPDAQVSAAAEAAPRTETPDALEGGLAADPAAGATEPVVASPVPVADVADDSPTDLDAPDPLSRPEARTP